ncbi:MAG TPA: aldose epimerase family protein [Bauldia sp.]|nr:aldose epimerase family protein [Bauldia sp.]
MGSHVFGRLPDGTEVREVAIAAGDLTVLVLTIGAVIRDVRLAGIDHPLVLGFDKAEDYVLHSPHVGAIAGRSANRIGGGRFLIDGKQHQVSLNEKGRNHLHGGFVGFGMRNWTLVASDATSVTLAITGADGEEGYPGKVDVTVRYSVEPGNVIRMEATAVTDAPTLVNLAQHSYFNLDDSPDILDHRVQILADSYTPTDGYLIPTGEILAVAGSNFDFRTPRPVRKMRGSDRVKYDLNYVVARQRAATLREQARVSSPKNGVTLSIASTEPGIQFYDGMSMNITARGLGGRRYAVNGGLCLEPQLFPDAPNHPSFPSSILRPGETYRQLTTFTFSR